MSDPARPNIIFFFTDQQRWDSMGLHGNPLDLTPNLDRLAREGTFLKNMFSCQPVCGPARSCLQSGMFATRTGCHKNAIPLPASEHNLAECFQRGGYETAYIGKWHLHDRETIGPVPEEARAGYQHWLASNVLEFTSDAYQTTLYNEQNEAEELPGYRVDALTDAAIRYVSQPKDQPYFLFLSYIEPHHQNHLDDYPPPIGYRERYTGRYTPPDLAALGGSSQQHLAGYWGMIKRLDEALGRLVDALASRGELENTIILFTSDHGCHFKTRNGEYKRSCHDASIRLPGMITGPGFTGGGEVRELVSLIDVPATLLEAAGLPVPDHYDGQPLGPLVRREDSTWRDHHFTQISESHVGRSVRTHRWKYAVAAPIPEGQNGDSRPWAEQMEEAFLYDLQCDPYELKNLIKSPAHAPVTDRLRALLLADMEAAGESLPEIIQADRTGGKGQRLVSDAEVVG